MTETAYVVMKGNRYKRPAVWAETKEEAEEWVEEDKKKDWIEEKPEYNIKELERAAP